ncbi:MAG: CHAP domain-containing protein [Candidatus Geothermincolia bacterium]
MPKLKGAGSILLVLLLALALLALPSHRVAASTVPDDDARYHRSYERNGCSFPAGWCTAYAAIRFSERSRAHGVDWNGNAKEWYANAAGTGWNTTADVARPQVGAIVCWSGGGRGLGHVAVVEEIYDGGVLISESNWEGFNVLSNTVLEWGEVQARNSYRFQGYIFPDSVAYWTGGSCVAGATAPATTFYFAEGTCRPGFETFLELLNPQTSEAPVTLTYILGDGSSRTSQLVVPALSRSTLRAKSCLGEGDDVSHDFSTVVSSAGSCSIVAERSMYFDYGGWTGGSCVVGATTAATAFYFAEGTCRPGFETYLELLNPSGGRADLSVTYMLGDGSGRSSQLSLPGLGRATIRVKSTLGEADDILHDFAIAVRSTNAVPIVAERSMYFDYGGWTGGSCVVGATAALTSAYFAEGSTRPGFVEYLALQNPGPRAVEVRATYSFGAGQGGPIERSYKVGPGQRVTVPVWQEVGLEKDVSIQLSAAGNFLAERPMYFRYLGYGAEWTGGSCTMGTSAPARLWLFAEGCTLPGFHEYLCLLNPGPREAVVRLSYLGPAGTPGPRDLVLPANSRVTVFVGQDAGCGLEVAARLDVLSGPDIVCERPMYFAFDPS